MADKDTLDPNTLEKLTVVKLKGYLRERGLEVKGVKAELVARLRAALMTTKEGDKESEVREDKGQETKQGEEAKHEVVEEEKTAAPTTITEPPPDEVKSPHHKESNQDGDWLMVEPLTEMERKEADANVAQESIEKPGVPVRKRTEDADEGEAPPKRQKRGWGSATKQAPAPISSDILDKVLPATQTPTAAATAPPAEAEEMDGVVEEKREVAPSTHPVTNSVCVRRLVRPFTEKQLRELLEQTGRVVKLWLSPIKDHCLVTYEKEEEAEATRNALHNVVWPPRSGRALSVEFCPPEDVEKAGQQPPVEAVPKEDPPPTTSKLDELFNKTQSKPQIYWIPKDGKSLNARQAAENTGEGTSTS